MQQTQTNASHYRQIMKSSLFIGVKYRTEERSIVLYRPEDRCLILSQQ